MKAKKTLVRQREKALQVIADSPGYRAKQRNTNSDEFDPNASYAEIVCDESWKQYRSKEYFDYRESWDSIPRNKLETDFPLHLDIETTNICNLLCPMCPRTVLIASDKFSDLGFMTREEYSNIIDQAAIGGAKSIKLNYLGEPLSHKDVVWQVKYAKDKGIIDVMMNTNASLLTPNVSSELLEAGLDALFVSFDAVDPELFEQQRVGTTLGKVINNLYEFIKLRRNINPSCQVRVSMVMFEGEKWAQQFDGLKAMWGGLVDAVGYGHYVERDQDMLGNYPEKEGFYCAQPYQRMFLKYNGNVTTCCVDDRDVEVFGNWRESGLRDIWLGTKYREFRELHSNGQYYKIDMCKKCYLPHSES